MIFFIVALFLFLLDYSIGFTLHHYYINSLFSFLSIISLFPGYTILKFFLVILLLFLENIFNNAHELIMLCYFLALLVLGDYIGPILDTSLKASYIIVSCFYLALRILMIEFLLLHTGVIGHCTVTRFFANLMIVSILTYILRGNLDNRLYITRGKSGLQTKKMP